MASSTWIEENMMDVLIVGSGVSGINAAYRIQESFPRMSYAVLESRNEIGGTWSLFKYPGIRSDSDLHTFGFPWDPWTEERSIADGPSILKYMKTVATKHGIDKHIKYHHVVNKIEWSSKKQRWTVHVTVNDDTEATYISQFIFMGTGLFDYHEGLPALIPGIQNFRGTVVHPQFWPPDLQYENKKIVIIGSGATAVTLLPNLNEKAAHVTMLQRSPGYFYSLPAPDPVDDFIRRWCPKTLVYKALRWRYILGFFFIYNFATLFPEATKKGLRKSTEAQLPKHIPYDPHFVPSYKPWQQRMCITPEGDFFRALRTGNSDIVTDHIERVDNAGIVLKSGGRLDADIIITATGLKMQLFGRISIFVDGKPIDHSTKFVWRGSWLQDVPNFAFAFGYTNASWTLGAETSTVLFIRLIKEIQKRGARFATPTIARSGDVQEVPWLNLNSNYIQKAIKNRQLPKAGNIAPWKPRSSYLQEFWWNKWGNITAGLKFGSANSSQC